MRKNRVVCPEWRSWGRWMILSCITSSSIHGAPFHRNYWKVIWWAFVTLLCRSKRSRLKAVFVPCCAANVCKYQKRVCHYSCLPRAWKDGDKPSYCSFLEFLICKFAIVSFRPLRQQRSAWHLKLFVFTSRFPYVLVFCHWNWLARFLGIRFADFPL